MLAPHRQLAGHLTAIDPAMQVGLAPVRPGRPGGRAEQQAEGRDHGLGGGRAGLDPDGGAGQVAHRRHGGHHPGSQGVGGATGDKLGKSIKAQMFGPDGTRIGGEILVNSEIKSSQTAQKITALADGGFVIAYEDWSLAYEWDANGNPTGMVPSVDPVLAQEIMSIAFQPSPPERADFNENPGE